MDTLHSDKTNRMVKFKALRKEKRITLVDMAAELGISPASLRRYENGERETPYGVYVSYADKLWFEVRELLKND